MVGRKARVHHSRVKKSIRPVGIKSFGPWWVRTSERLDAKEDGFRMALTWQGGDELHFLEKGCYPAVDAIWAAWSKKWPNVLKEYAEDHGKPLKSKTLGDRVYHFYYKNNRRKNAKGKCISQQHPDNSKHYALVRRIRQRSPGNAKIFLRP